MSKSEMIAYIAGSLTTVVLCASVFVNILFFFKRKDFSKCHKCDVFLCPRSMLWKESKDLPRGLFRFSPVFIFGIITILVAVIVAVIWFIFLFVTLYPTILNSLT